MPEKVPNRERRRRRSWAWHEASRQLRERHLAEWKLLYHRAMNEVSALPPPKWETVAQVAWSEPPDEEHDEQDDDDQERDF